MNAVDCKALDTAKITKEEHMALKMLSKGEADAGQQTLALAMIVKKFSRANDLAYIPGSHDESSFLAGRTYVGKQIQKYIKLPVED